MAKPPTTKPNKVIDDASVPEVFSDTLLGAHVNEGNAVLTFGIERLMLGKEGRNIPTYQKVVSRLVLTKAALEQIVEALPRLSGAISFDDKTAAGGQKKN